MSEDNKYGFFKDIQLTNGALNVNVVNGGTGGTAPVTTIADVVIGEEDLTQWNLTPVTFNVDHDSFSSAVVTEATGELDSSDYQYYEITDNSSAGALPGYALD